MVDSKRSDMAYKNPYKFRDDIPVDSVVMGIDENMTLTIARLVVSDRKATNPIIKSFEHLDTCIAMIREIIDDTKNPDEYKIYLGIDSDRPDEDIARISDALNHDRHVSYIVFQPGFGTIFGNDLLVMQQYVTEGHLVPKTNIGNTQIRFINY